MVLVLESGLRKTRAGGAFSAQDKRRTNSERTHVAPWWPHQPKATPMPRHSRPAQKNLFASITLNIHSPISSPKSGKIGDSRGRSKFAGSQ
jgi:hypothetical protein